MRELFQTMREVAWALVVVLGVAALVIAVLQPQIFAARLAGVFDALEREGFDVQIKTPVGEASFDRSKAEQLENSDEIILALREEVAALQAENVALIGEQLQPLPPLPPTDPARPSPDNPGEDLGEPVIEEPVIEEPVLVPSEPAAPEWVAIAGAETSLAGQREELIRLQSGGFPDAVILKTGKWYQSSVIFPNRAEAEAGLPAVAQIVGVNRGAYLRALDVMCPSMWPLDGESDVYSCD